jgi:hypothetical protein
MQGLVVAAFHSFKQINGTFIGKGPHQLAYSRLNSAAVRAQYDAVASAILLIDNPVF